MWSAAVKDVGDLAGLRSQVGEMLDAHGVGHCADTVLLLVSELATNAVLHADGPRVLELHLTASTVRVQVLDGSTELPILVTSAPLVVGGNGMRLVDALATRWGTDARFDGKAVWFELAT